MTTAPTAGRRRHRWVHRLALVVLVAVVLAAVGYDASEIAARHRSDAALATTTAEVGQTRATLSATGGRLGMARALLTERQRAAALTAAALGETDQNLTAVSTTDFLQSLNIDTLRTCLSGVSQAVSAIGASNLPSAVRSITAASPACLALDGTSGGLSYPFDFPDPFILTVGSEYFGFATNSAAGNIQIIQSSNLANWVTVGDALPAEPAWATPGYTWGPSVLQRGNTFVLYYATIDTATGLECISDAVATQPQGPYLDTSTAPLVCQTSLGGSIDPTPFVDTDGTPYLIWKSNGAAGQPPTLWSEQLNPAGTALAPGPRAALAPGPPAAPAAPEAPGATPAPTTTTTAPGATPAPATPTALLTPGEAWQGGIIEGPAMVLSGTHYLLFYSGNNWNSANYAIGVADCSSPLGPCSEESTQPLLASQPAFSGPGGPAVFTDTQGQLWLAFHAWLPEAVGYPHSRLLFLRPLSVTAGVPQVGP